MPSSVGMVPVNSLSHSSRLVKVVFVNPYECYLSKNECLIESECAIDGECSVDSEDFGESGVTCRRDYFGTAQAGGGAWVTAGSLSAGIWATRRPFSTFTSW